MCVCVVMSVEEHANVRTKLRYALRYVLQYLVPVLGLRKAGTLFRDLGWQIGWCRVYVRIVRSG